MLFYKKIIHIKHGKQWNIHTEAEKAEPIIIDKITSEEPTDSNL